MGRGGLHGSGPRRSPLPRPGPRDDAGGRLRAGPGRADPGPRAGVVGPAPALAAFGQGLCSSDSTWSLISVDAIWSDRSYPDQGGQYQPGGATGRPPLLRAADFDGCWGGGWDSEGDYPRRSIRVPAARNLKPSRADSAERDEPATRAGRTESRQGQTVTSAVPFSATSSPSRLTFPARIFDSRLIG